MCYQKFKNKTNTSFKLHVTELLFVKKTINTSRIGQRKYNLPRFFQEMAFDYSKKQEPVLKKKIRKKVSKCVNTNFFIF